MCSLWTSVIALSKVFGLGDYRYWVCFYPRLVDKIGENYFLVFLLWLLSPYIWRSAFDFRQMQGFLSSLLRQGRLWDTLISCPTCRGGGELAIFIEIKNREALPPVAHVFVAKSCIRPGTWWLIEKGSLACVHHFEKKRVCPPDSPVTLRLSIWLEAKKRLGANVRSPLATVSLG